MVFILLVLLRTRNFSAPYYFVLLHTISYYFARARARTRLSRAAFVNNFPSTCRLRKGSETRRGSAHSLRLWQSGALALTADNGDRSIPCNVKALGSDVSSGSRTLTLAEQKPLPNAFQKAP